MPFGAYPRGMKRVVMILVASLLLTGCGQSDEARAAELVTKSCKSHLPAKTETLIRQATQLDEKYRPYLIAWLKWQRAASELGQVITGSKAHLAALKDLKDNYLIQDSYCPE